MFFINMNKIFILNILFILCFAYPNQTSAMSAISPEIEILICGTHVDAKIFDKIMTAKKLFELAHPSYSKLRFFTGNAFIQEYILPLKNCQVFEYKEHGALVIQAEHIIRPSAQSVYVKLFNEKGVCSDGIKFDWETSGQ